MTERRVKCAKLGRELPGLEKPPFPGALGQRIYENVSREAMRMWDREAESLLRQGLSMADPASRKEMLRRMEEFLLESPVEPAPAEDASGGEGLVNCVKFGKPLPAMDKPPFPGALGQRIFENVSEPGWKLWEEHSKIVLNHYGLSLADPEARKFMFQQMEEFFFGEGARLPEDWVPPSQGGKGGAPGGKAPVAQSK